MPPRGDGVIPRLWREVVLPAALAVGLVGFVCAWWAVGSRSSLQSASHWVGNLQPTWSATGWCIAAALGVAAVMEWRRWGLVLGAGGMSWAVLVWRLPVDIAYINKYDLTLATFAVAVPLALGIHGVLRLLPAGRKPRWVARVSPLAIVLIVAVGFTVIGTVLSIRAYNAYIPGANDLGMYDQIHWSMFRHRMFHTTLFEIPFGARLSQFDNDYHAEHFMPILFFTSMIHYVLPHPVTLLVMHMLVLGGALVAVWFAARRILENDWLAVGAVVVLAMNPLFQIGALNEFYPDAFVPLFVIGAFCCLERHSMPGYIVCMVAAMMCKEDVPIWLAFFGIFLGWAKRDWRLGALTVAMGVGYFLLIATPVMQHAVAGHDGSYIRHVNRYGHLFPVGLPAEAGIAERLIALVQSPGRLVQHLLAPPQLSAALLLLLPIGVIALFYPPAWIAIFPVMMAHLLSNWGAQSRFEMYHALGVLPWVGMASLYSARPVAQRLRNMSPAGACLWAMVAFVGLVFLRLGVFPGGGRHVRMPAAPPPWTAELDAIVEMIPEGAAVAATSNLVPRLARRAAIYMLPHWPEDVEYVAISNRGRAAPVSPSALLHQVRRQMARGEWEILAGAPGRDCLLLRRVP